MKPGRSRLTNPDMQIASTMTCGDPVTKVSSISSAETTCETTLKCCPINNTFNIVGKKFTILILRDIINGKQNRFNQLLSSIEDCNPKTLSVRLREMEKNGLIKRKVYSNERPVRVEYQSTEKALAFQPILDIMAAYSLRYCSKDVLNDGRPREFKEVYGREINSY